MPRGVATVRGRDIALALFCATLCLATMSGVCRAGIAVDRLTSEVVAGPGETYRGAVVVRNTADEMSCLMSLISSSNMS